MIRRKLIELLGGFPDFESARAATRSDKVFEEVLKGTDREEILRRAVKRLYHGIEPEDLLRFDRQSQTFTFMSKPLSPEQTLQIINEAKMFQASRLRRVLIADMRYQLSRKMFEEGRFPDDFLWGQLATWLWDVIMTRINELSSL